MHIEKNVKLFSSGTCRGPALVIDILIKNLVENGVKYNTAAIPLITIRQGEKDQHYWISVEDNGIGIPTEFQEKIFNMFFRMHDRGTYQGTGLGLAIVRRLTDYIGGTITLQSEENKGSVFTIRWPKEKTQSGINH
ncbi:MAG: sensor histidine kinase [Phaeodactylibacter xiamenensis]|uniref:histidine kinase n=1 Tax=Phaeodactylibacter xiamenensis TaxID=1524460 RepID=A0A098S722_9BACT|nr:sensor histidine kinase [Phaeodactylibacter xiamenensis]KGE86907.1 hypothetical protein IX84_17790 [Phaeodactylibacter xiamenensis]MCR9053225.1 sensor histidine kinase [bacterium]